MEYFANFYVNNGTRLQKPLRGNNLRELIEEIEKYASCEIFQFNRGSVVVVDDEGCMEYCASAKWNDDGDVYWEDVT